MYSTWGQNKIKKKKNKNSLPTLPEEGMHIPNYIKKKKKVNMLSKRKEPEA